jgi:outer membrane protein assembly factor BamE
MRLLSSQNDSRFAPSGATAAVLLALLLTACAARNPLMEEPAASAKPAPAPTQVAKETAKPAAATPVAVPSPSTSAQAPAAAQPVKPAAAPAASAPVAAAPAQPAPAAPAPVAKAAPVAAAPAAPAAPAATAAPMQMTPVASVPSGVQTTEGKRFLGFLSPYRPDIQQGNFVSREMVAQLKPDMTADQVRFVLGTPLLTDIFHATRWDYVFRMKKGNGEVTTSRLAVFFKEGRLARVEGGDLPTEEDYLARLAGNAPPPKAAATGTAPAVSAEAAKAAAPSAAAPK